MAAAGTPFKRLFLRKLFWDAEEGGDTLLNGLKAAAKASLQGSGNGSGKVLIGTSANGHAYQWEVSADFTPVDQAELISNLIDRYYEARAKLVADDIASPTDQQIFDEMMDKLKPVRSLRQDFTGLRCQPTEVEV